MPTINNARQRKSPSAPKAQDLEDTIEVEAAPRRTTKKNVPVGKIVSGSIEKNISDTIAQALVESTLSTMGPLYAITPKEAYNVCHPLLDMLSRRMPNVALKLNLEKQDADDIELLIITGLNYVTRLVNTYMKLRLRAQLIQRGLIPPDHAAPSQPPQPPRQTYREPQMPMNSQPAGQSSANIQREAEDIAAGYDPELFEDQEPDDSGTVDGIVPMRSTGVTFEQLMQNGDLPGDKGDTVV